MRRTLLTVVMALGLVAGGASQAGAISCVRVKPPKPCAGVARCTWGGDPEAVWVVVRGGTLELALSRAAKVRRNLQTARVKPRVLDLQALKGEQETVVISKTYRLKGRHWYFSSRKNCWYVRLRTSPVRVGPVRTVPQRPGSVTQGLLRSR